MNEKIYENIPDLIKEINTDILSWHKNYQIAWFRAEKEELENSTPLIPKLYLNAKKLRDRKISDIENDIVQEFRMRAKAFPNSPDYNRIDEWLFLMRHVETCTRLLDWSEGALIALYFAINKFPQNGQKPILWMVNPIILNLVANNRLFLPLSWNDGTNIYNQNTGELVYYKNEQIKNEYRKCPGNILAAFEVGKCKYEEKNPIALKPQHIHPRVTAQRGAFTVHGEDKRGIFDIVKDIKLINSNYSEIFEYSLHNKSFDLFLDYERKNFGEAYLKKYIITDDENKLKKMLNELKILGITNSTLFPDLVGLANEMNYEYFLKYQEKDK